MLKSVEEFLYWTISLLINLLLLSFLATLFIVRIKDVPELHPLKVEVRELEVERPREIRSTVKAKPISERSVSKRREPVGGGGGVGVSSVHERGDVKVPTQEDVSILSEVRRRVEKRLTEEERKEVGSISAVVLGSELRIKGGTRKILYTPPAPELVSTEFPSAVRIRIWVDPEGRVIKAVLLQRSGSVNIDNTLLSFVRGFRFEKVQEQEVQVGEISFSFRGG